MSEVLERLQAALPGGEYGVSADGIPFVRLPPERIPQAVADLRHRLGYERFVDLTAVDDPRRPDRFELQYLFYSLQARQWIRIKTRTADEVPSITASWPGANFYEREVFDLFGVRFIGHPDLRRILLPDDWQGHPLRRDEPLGGEPVEFSHTVQDQHYGRDPRGTHGR